MTEVNPNRREILVAGAAVAAGPTLGRLSALAQLQPDNATVVRVSSNHVVRGRTVHATILSEMLDATLRRVTGKVSSREAWRSLLRADDLIGLKFNRSGAEGLGTTKAFCETVVASLIEAGFERRQIVAIEIDARLRRELGVQGPVHGWHESVTAFGSGKDRLASVLDQVTAIINIPFIKTHNIAGFTGCMKNLSHALVKHPARFHGGHCSPYIPDIVALPQIRDKIRLNLVNGLRIVFDKGPEAHDAYTWDAGVILAGHDFVAADAMGLRLVNSQRAIMGLRKIGQLDKAVYIEVAAQRGLGRSQRHQIELVEARL